MRQDGLGVCASLGRVICAVWEGRRVRLMTALAPFLVLSQVFSGYPRKVGLHMRVAKAPLCNLWQMPN